MTPPPGLRLGNLLYVWLQAHRRTRAGAPTLALEARAMEPWLTAFPELAALTIPQGSVRFRDRREWDAAWLYQRFGADFTADDVDGVRAGDDRAARRARPHGDARRQRPARRLLHRVRRASTRSTRSGYLEAALERARHRPSVHSWSRTTPIGAARTSTPLIRSRSRRGRVRRTGPARELPRRRRRRAHHRDELDVHLLGGLRRRSGPSRRPRWSCRGSMRAWPTAPTRTSSIPAGR